MIKLFLSIVSVFIAMLILFVPAQAGPILIEADKIITNTSDPIMDKNILIDENGQFRLVIKNVVPKNATVMKGKKYWVTPGIFAPYSTLGLVEVSGEHATNNINSSDEQASVHIRAADSFNPKSTIIPVTRVGGVTHAAIIPGNGTDLFGGIGAVVSTTGAFNSVSDPSAFVYLNLSGRSTRTGDSKGAAFAFLRDALDDADNYSNRFKAPGDGNALRRADARALRPVVSGAQKILIDADQAMDIVNILALKKKRPKLDIVIVGAAEGWMVADRLAKAGVPVIIDPMEDLPYNFDQIGSRLDNAALLNKAGVSVAIMSRSNTGGSAHNLRLLPQHAGNAVTNGLTWDVAFKAITMVPANIFSRPQLGILKNGQTANLVVWDGDPLEVTSAPVAVFIDGKLQSMVTRQTMLRDRYNPKNTPEAHYGYHP